VAAPPVAAPPVAAPPVAAPPVAAPPAAAPPPPAALDEPQPWLAIESSATPADFKDYLRKYPYGEFSDLARKRLADLQLHPVQVPGVVPNSGPQPMSISDVIVDQDKLSGKLIKVRGKFGNCIILNRKNLCNLIDENITNAFVWFDPNTLPRDDYKHLLNCVPLQCVVTVGGLYANGFANYRIQATSIDFQ
jgi:hypothetical protein